MLAYDIYIIFPYMLQFDELMKNTFYEEGWAEDCKDDDLILSLYENIQIQY